MAQQPATPQSSAPGKGAPAAQSQAAPPANIPGLPTAKDRVSYAIGMNIGVGMHKDDLDVDPDMLLRGLKDGMSGGKTLMTDEQARAEIAELRNQMMAKMQAKTQQESEENKKKGEAFLAENKTKPGVIALPSGLQYKILKEGTGPKPTATDSVKCNYKGTLVDGKEFDASGEARRSGNVPGDWRHQGMDRGAAIDAGGIEVAAVYSFRYGVRRAWRGRRYRAE